MYPFPVPLGIQQLFAAALVEFIEEHLAAATTLGYCAIIMTCKVAVSCLIGLATGISVWG